MLDLVVWWYGPGWSGAIAALQRRAARLDSLFSVAVLLRTLFAPWRRIVTYPGAGLQRRLRAMGDNLVSRSIGFTMRFFVLLAAAALFLMLGVASVLEIICWPLVPFAGLGLIIWGLVR